jgi:hypothetical protein
MEKLVVFKEEEFNNLLVKFADELVADWKKGWGYKVISRENGKDMLEEERDKDGYHHMYGALMLAWNKIFQEK